MPMLSAFLAMFWLTLSVGLLLLDYHNIETGHLALDENRYKIAMLAFVLFGYNLFRYRMQRLQQRYRREAQDPPPRPRRVDEE